MLAVLILSGVSAFTSLAAYGAIDRTRAMLRQHIERERS